MFFTELDRMLNSYFPATLKGSASVITFYATASGLNSLTTVLFCLPTEFLIYRVLRPEDYFELNYLSVAVLFALYSVLTALSGVFVMN